MKYSTNYL